MSQSSGILTALEAEFIYSQVQDDLNGLGDLQFLAEDVTLGNHIHFIQPDPVQVKLESQAFPPPTTAISMEEYAGSYDFEVDIYPNGSKNAWVYSASLNKVYMNIRSPFPVDFKVKNRPDILLFIRATPVYSAPQFAHECVCRCLNHEHSSSSDSLMQNNRQHILKCSNQNAQYQGDKNKNERLSVVLPFSYPQTGATSVREIFEFLCKNSCPTPGMNRRAIEVIFTLEDEHGRILGRRLLNVRVCSCPKRDKEKDEKEHNKDMGQLPRGKKRKVEGDKKVPSIIDNDIKEVTIPIAGKHNVQQLLKYAHDLMAGEIVERANTGTDVPYQRCLKTINDIIRNSHD